MNRGPREATGARRAGARRTGRPYEQIVIEAVSPSVDGGRQPVKGIVGDILAMEATVFRHGHERVRAAVLWKPPGERAFPETPMTPVNPGLDRWRSELRLEPMARYRFTIAGWTDLYASWVEELGNRVRAAQVDVASELAEALTLVERALKGLRGETRRQVGILLDRLRDSEGEPARVLDTASSEEALALMTRWAPWPDLMRYEPELIIIADRERARAGAWYELFVRSQGTQPGRSGTFRDAERRLADIHHMGFDVVYLAPIHPIGRTDRKGPNNRLEADPDDPGSPWAIGDEHGGHTAIEPALGTVVRLDPVAGEPAHVLRVEKG